MGIYKVTYTASLTIDEVEADSDDQAVAFSEDTLWDRINHGAAQDLQWTVEAVAALEVD